MTTTTHWQSGDPVTRAGVLSHPRRGGAVARYHTWPTINQQTVADHTWNVLRIFLALFGDPAPAVLRHIMFHDVGELHTGDPPFPFKARHPEVKRAYDAAEEAALNAMGLYLAELEPEQRTAVKLCDLLEMTEFGLNEIAMGNRLAEPIVRDTLAAVVALCPLGWSSEVSGYIVHSTTNLVGADAVDWVNDIIGEQVRARHVSRGSHG